MIAMGLDCSVVSILSQMTSTMLFMGKMHIMRNDTVTNPRLTRIIKRTNMFVKAPCKVFENYKFMFKTQFICDMFEPDEFGYLVDECNTNGLSIRYGRVKPDTPSFEDDHQVVVPPKSIYRMKTADRDFNGFIKHIDVCTKKMKAERVDFASRLVDIGRP